MKKCIALLFFFIPAISCEEIEDPDEPACWICAFSTVDEYWEEEFCDLTYYEIKDYEAQVYTETSGEISVDCR